MPAYILSTLLLTVVLAAVSSCSLPGVMVREEPFLTSKEHIQLAHIYEAEGEYDLSLENFRKALLLDPENPEIHFAVGNIYFTLKDFQEAESSYLRAAELSPAPGDILNNLAWVYMETGRIKDARSSAEKAIEKDPSRRYIYLDTLGVIETRAGNFPEAEKNFTEALGLVPPEERRGRLEILKNLLELYRITGETGKETEVEKKIRGL